MQPLLFDVSGKSMIFSRIEPDCMSHTLLLALSGVRGLKTMLR